MTPLQFVDKWRPVILTERSAAQSHFLDLCRLFDHPSPIDMDPTGQEFTFEKGVHKAGGGEGFADVWKRGFFAWEYKKRKRNLDDALGQLSRYALALENPPLQIVCDTDRFRIVTAYTNSVPPSYDLSLEDLLDSGKRDWLESAFYAPKKLQPGADRSDLTKQAADKLSTLAQRLQAKGYSIEDVGHFVNRLVFLFFAEDVGLLKGGFFRRTVSELAGRPADSKVLLTDLFLTFRTGGRFGLDRLPWINGGLFDDREALPLDEHEVALLKAASSQNWSHIDPTIFGTLFERFLDPDKRAQIGAHYTDADKIEQIIEPVIFQPLREEWDAARADIQALVTKAKSKGSKAKDWQRAEERRTLFLERLRTLSILDPACGSGNFLYLALHGVKNLEHAANQECESLGLPPRMPMVGPEILRGIEINPLAAELARTTVWIGDIQWSIQNGIRSRPEPILRRLDVIECRDALIGNAATSATDGPAKWPDADFIVGNPPFLGASKMLGKLGKEQTDAIRKAFSNSIDGTVDLYVYWFAKSLDQILSGKAVAAGLVSKNTFQQNSNSTILREIKRKSDIFCVHSRVPWVNDGAAVEVHLICFSAKGKDRLRRFNGQVVSEISSDLSVHATGAEFADYKPRPLLENKDYCFNGVKRNGPFDIDGTLARTWLLEPRNPNGKHNSDVLAPYMNGDDLTGRNRDRWLIDFGFGHKEEDIAFYEKPFAYAKAHVKPARREGRTPSLRNKWWEYEGLRKRMRTKLSAMQCYFALSEKSHQYVWQRIDSKIIPDNRLIVVASESPDVFGVLQSRFHERWMEKTGSLLQDRRCYTPTTTFSTFPFPISLSSDNNADQHANDPHQAAIGLAALKLLNSRDRWLNPPEYVQTETEVCGKYHRLVAKGPEAVRELKKRTLAALYNDQPDWLLNAHRNLDAAVASAYGWPEDISTEDALAALLNLNRERAAAQGKA